MKLFSKLKNNTILMSMLAPAYHLEKYAIAKIAHLLEPKNANYLETKLVTPKDAHCFFGYYDKCPWDITEQYMLCLKTPFAWRMARANESASICIIDLQHGKHLLEIGQTTAWCWQQGCMLQWFNGYTDRCILYNDFREKHYVTVICNVLGQILQILPRPTYALSRNEKKILSLNFSRLHFCRPGYGYIAEPFVSTKALCPEDDGIFLVDIDSGESQLIISLKEITKINPKEEFSQSLHYFNHIEFNPSSTRFVFYHRWKSKENGMEKTRMYTAAPDGSDLYCLSDHDMVSHYAWKDDNHLLAWANHPLAGQHYYLYEDKTESVTVVGDGVLVEDGHPSFSADCRWILTDTYPDSKRCRTLVLFDTQTFKRYDIGRFFVPFLFNGPIRCDLHPRWNSDSTKVCFDSVHEGKRCMYTMDVSHLLF